MNDVTAQAGDPAAPSTPGAPAAPPTPAEARAERNGLMQDKGFATAYFNGDVAARTKWNALGEVINGPDPSDAVARAMSNEPPSGIIQNSDDVQMRGQADFLRSRGFNEAQVRETLENAPKTQAEKDIAARWMQMNLNSKEFQARWNAKEPDAMLLYTAANVTLNATLKE